MRWSRIIALAAALPLIAWSLPRQTLAELTDYRLPVSRYMAGGNTIGIFNGSRETVTVVGQLQHRLLLAQRQGLRVSLVERDGRVAWTHTTPRPIVGLEKLGDVAIVGYGASLTGFDIATGSELWSVKAPGRFSGIGVSDKAIYAAVYADRPVIMRFDIDQPNRPPAGPVPTSVPLGGDFPRHIAFDGDQVLVARTFGDAVSVIKPDATVHDAPFFFPNQIQALGGDQYLVIEEHANRLVRWSMDTGQRTTVLSCPDPLFSDPHNGRQQFEASQERTNRRYFFQRTSVCDARLSDQTMFAPNGFHAADDRWLYVADTDNHRVFLHDLTQGTQVGEIGGLNNPVRVIALPN